MYQVTCKKCRRLGYKVCNSEKCALLRKPYAPGQHGKARSRRPSEFGSQLAEKQKLRLLYDVREKQFKKYFDLAIQKKGVTANILLELLERRLDNAIFRLGLASSRQASRQLISHGHILVNGKKVTAPSYCLKIKDQITIKDSSKAKKIFNDLRVILKKFQPPQWLELDKEQLNAKVIGLPTPEAVGEIALEMSKVLEYYSR
jgi:small subunit ribosomal protein S4